jgi:hypothetical protein
LGPASVWHKEPAASLPFPPLPFPSVRVLFDFVFVVPSLLSQLTAYLPKGVHLLHQTAATWGASSLFPLWHTKSSIKPLEYLTGPNSIITISLAADDIIFISYLFPCPFSRIPFDISNTGRLMLPDP